MFMKHKIVQEAYLIIFKLNFSQTDKYVPTISVETYIPPKGKNYFHWTDFHASKFVRQRFVTNSNTEFYDNSTSGLVATTTLQTDQHKHVFFI